MTSQAPPSLVNVAVSGHRVLPAGDLIRKLEWEMVQIMRHPRVGVVYIGGAIGADTEALLACSRHRTGSSVQVIVVVPNTVEDQPWEARQHFHLADRVIELGNPISKEDRFKSYLIRNEYLVDHSSLLLAVWDGRVSGGTYHAVRHAIKTNKPYRTVWC